MVSIILDTCNWTCYFWLSLWPSYDGTMFNSKIHFISYFSLLFGRNFQFLSYTEFSHWNWIDLQIITAWKGKELFRERYKETWINEKIAVDAENCFVTLGSIFINYFYTCAKKVWDHSTRSKIIRQSFQSNFALF